MIGEHGQILIGESEMFQVWTGRLATRHFDVLGPSLTASRFRRVLVAVVSASVVCMMLSQTVAEAQPLRGPRAGIAPRSESRHAVRSLSARCVALGLKPISAKLTLFLAGDWASTHPS